MPGITGIIGPSEAQETPSALPRMVQAMVHESFHVSGTYVHESLGLRLGWVSLRGSFADGMPIWNEKKDVGLVFCGEDYTDPGEVESLRARGHRFEPGDASYLVHLYEENGADFVARLNGRFSGVIIDLRDRRFLLFNDRYGLNRIYCHENARGLFFSSEAKSLLKVFPGLRNLDPTGLAETYACGCVLQNRTLFPGISLVPGGSIWTGSGQEIHKRRYFRPSIWTEQETLGIEEYPARLKETWIRILPRYFQGKERVAVSLTGGKDSRMIMAWASSPPGTLPCYTFGSLFRDCEDVKLARRVAKLCGQSHEVITVGKSFLKEFPDLAAKTVYITDGTLDVSGSTELYVNRIARQIAPVRLTGNYGQEILRSAIAFRPQPFSPGWLETSFAQLVRNASLTYQAELEANRLSFVVFKQVPWHHYSRLSLELSQVTLRSPFLDNDLVALAFRVPRSLGESVELQLRLIAQGHPSLGKIGTDRALLLDAGPVLSRINNWYREFTFKAEYAYDYGMPQWLAAVDHALRSFHLERLFLGRHKFYHFRIWYRDDLSESVKSILLDPRTRTRPYWQPRSLERMVREHSQGVRNYTSEIHQMLTSELIYRQLIDPS